ARRALMMNLRPAAHRHELTARHASVMTSRPRTPRPPASLKMVAIGCLSRREYSRQELRARLLAELEDRERRRLAAAQDTLPEPGASAPPADPRDAADLV